MCNFATDIKQLFTTMKQRYAVVVLFALIIASSMVSLTSYKATEELVTEDMNQALAKALDEQQSDVISADTIQVFNKYLQRPTAFDDSLVDGVAMGNVLSV